MTSTYIEMPDIGLERGILIVEPDPNTQWHLARMLTVMGHRVVGTSSLSGAEMLLSKWRVDLVLLSETISKKTSDPLTAGLDAGRSRLPIVLIADESNDPSAEFITTTGMVHRMRRPFAPEKVAKLLEMLLPSTAASLPAE